MEGKETADETSFTAVFRASRHNGLDWTCGKIKRHPQEKNLDTHFFHFFGFSLAHSMSPPVRTVEGGGPWLCRAANMSRTDKKDAELDTQQVLRSHL
jgi:hypothetical protein